MFEGTIVPERELHAGTSEILRMATDRVAVIVPCYNEEAAIGAVVADFAKALPMATAMMPWDRSNGSLFAGRSKVRFLSPDPLCPTLKRRLDV